jgi:O-antigen/teichoic acid export membrane protein
MISSRFLKSTVSYSIAGALPMLSGLILLPFYTNLLETADYGVLMLYVAFSLFIQILVSYSIDAYMGAHYTEVRDNVEKKRELISNSAGLLLTIGLVFIVTMLAIGKPVFDASFNRSGNMNFYPYGIMSVITGFFNSFFRSYTYLLIFEKKPGLFFLLNFANFALTIAISIIGLKLFPDSLVGPMYGRLLSGAGIFLLSLIGFLRLGGISFRFSVLKGINAFCIPYVAYVLLTWISANIDRFLINDLIDPEGVAIFDFAVKCTLLIDFVQSGMVSAIQPEVFAIWNREAAQGTSKESNKYFHSFTGISMLLIGLFMVCIPPLIPYLVKRDDFYDSFVIMGILASSFATRGIYYYFVSIILYLKKTRLLLYAFALSAAVQIPTTYIFTHQWGVAGAAFAALLAKVVQCLMLYFVIRNHFTIQVNISKLVIVPALIMFALGIIWYMTPEWYVLPYILFTLGVAVIILIQYKKEIGLLARKFLQRKVKS